MLHEKDRGSRDARLDRDARKTASKYDFVKVKVWLGEEKAHYYVLSRFLISRSLTVTKIPHLKAVKIALELKKFCVDNDMLDISQAQMEEVLFQIMQSRGFSDTYVRRYRMVTRFHLQRRPLVIFISGTACTGKSTLAQQLAARLNLPNVLQTDIIYQLLQASLAAPLDSAPLWRRGDLSTEGELLAAYHHECGVVRRGIDADLGKCIRDGKSFIIEGLHLDPGRYIYEFGRHGMSQLQPMALTPQPSAAEGLPPQVEEEAAAAAAAEQDAQAKHQLAGAQGRAAAPEPSAFAAAEQQQQPLASPPQPPKPHASPPRRSGFRQHSGEAPPGSTRQRIQDRLRRLPGRSSSVHDDLTDLPAAAPAHAMQKPPPRRAASAVTGSTPRMLFALRQDASAAATAGSSETEDGAGGLRPRLAPWPAAKALLESLRPYDHHHALDAALTKLHLRQKGGGAGRSNGNSDSSLSTALQLSGQQHAGNDARQRLSGLDPAHSSSQHSAAARDGSFDSAPASDTVTAADVDGRRRRDSQSVRFLETGTTLSHSSDAAGPAGRDAAEEAAPPEPDSQLGPVFVPIVLAMDEDTHGPLLDEWLARQPASPGCCSDAEALARVHLLQNHFCAYQAQAVPVVRISVDNFARTLDGLHDYLLQCMELAMADEQQPVG